MSTLATLTLTLAFFGNSRNIAKFSINIVSFFKEKSPTTIYL
jgi:hypothetical protein